MFKKIVQIATTLGLLAAGYAGYIRGFAAIASRVEPPRVVPIVAVGIDRSVTAKEADAIMARAFGPEHWSARPDQKSFRYYDSNRGYWMSAQEYTPSNDNKRLVLRPFVLVWQSKDRRSLKMMSGDQATVDFNQPLDMTGKSSQGSPQVVFARIDGDVRLRDDKGTPLPGDDLSIGPMTYLEYDGPTDQIRSESSVVLRDRDLTATGVGLRIDLRPREAQPGGAVGSTNGGYVGARTAILQRNVHIAVKDVGRGGIVPGTGQPAASAGGNGPRPGDIQCDGPMRIDLPRPRPSVVEGPPEASEPTYATFTRNVKVRQGDPARPDTCDADVLHLTLIPGEDLPSTPEARAEADARLAAKPYLDATAEPAPPGAVNGLTLVKAEATSEVDNVWLQSPTQGMVGVGSQLIYERHMPVDADMIYFRGKNYTDLEKVNLHGAGPKVGEVESIDRMRTKDVTIYQRGPNTATVIARGPGRIETRPGRGQPVERSAAWLDRLEVQPVGDADSSPDGQRRKVTLYGKPELSSPTQGVLHARDTVVAWLKPKQKSAAGAATTSAAAAPGARDSSTIERMQARGDVRMVVTKLAAGWKADDPKAPYSTRTIHARNQLDVEFLEGEPVVAKVEPEPKPAEILPEPTGEAVAQAEPDDKQPAPEPEKKAAEPNLDARADQVWAKVAPRPGTDKPDVQEVRLRGDVAVHQDPEAGKDRGTDAWGDKIDLTNRGEGRARIDAHGNNVRPAAVINAEMAIQGPALHLDQAENQAWVEGAGRLTQRSASGALAGAKPEPKARDGAKPADTSKAVADVKPRADAGPMDITWIQGMTFYGQPVDAQGRAGLAYADFRGRVHAETTGSAVDCDRMVAYLDRPVPFLREKADPAAVGPAEDRVKTKPEVVRVHCFRGVDIVNRELDKEDGLLKEKQRVRGEDVLFDRPTGTFTVKGAGLVYHYARDDQDGDSKAGAPAPAGREASRPRGNASRPTDDPRVITVADNRRVPAGAPPVPSATPGAGRVAASNGRKPMARPAAPAPAEDKPKLVLTRIAFGRQMIGRFSASELERSTAPDEDGAKPEPKRAGPRRAEFEGDIRVLRAGVPDESADLDEDDPPADFLLMTCDRLRMATEPAPDGSKEKGYEYLNALGNSQVTTRDKAIRGDEIRYSSANALVFVYGYENEVLIAQQQNVGQPVSAGRGNAVIFNTQTRETKVVDPRSIQLFDAASGGRADPAAAPKEKKEKKPQRPLNNPLRSDKERRGFR